MKMAQAHCIVSEAMERVSRLFLRQHSVRTYLGAIRWMSNRAAFQNRAQQDNEDTFSRSLVGRREHAWSPTKVAIAPAQARTSDRTSMRAPSRLCCQTMMGPRPCL